MTDEAQERPADETTPETKRSAGMLGAFLPLGLVFMGFGLVQGVADDGLAFFTIGVAFFAIAMSAVPGAAQELRRGPAATDATVAPDAAGWNGEADGADGADGNSPDEPIRPPEH